MLKREERQLESALHNLERVQSYLLRDDVLVCRRQSHASTTLHFTNDQGDICYAVNKEIGSDLALLRTAIRQLGAVLNPPTQEALL